MQELGYELNLPEAHLQNSQNTLKQFRIRSDTINVKDAFKRTRKIVAIDGAVLEVTSEVCVSHSGILC